jgi:tetratricopeptide (TPR) repeat protein
VSLLAEGGDHVDSARASVSWALEQIDAGCFDDAIALLDGAARVLDGADGARAAAQRALALQRAGRVIDAKDGWDRAVEAFGLAGMPVEEATARQNRGLVHVYRGEFREAEDDLEEAAKVFADRGEAIRALEVLHNRGFVAARSGNLPKAMALFDQAQSRASQLGVLRPEVLVDRAEVTLDAGLVSEGRALAEAAVGILEQGGFDADVPEACLLAARACELDGDPLSASRWARTAMTRFGSQARARWQLLARFAVLRAEAAADPGQAGGAEQFLELAGSLRAAGWWAQAVEAEVRAVEELIDAGRPDDATPILDGLTPTLAQAGALTRLQVRLAQARLRWALGDADGAQRALLAGLRALLAYQATLGSLELRGRAAGKADDVLALGLRMAAARQEPARALWWMEAIRAAADTAAVNRPISPDTSAALESLREVTMRLGRESLGPAEATRLRRSQAALEEVIRRHSRHAPGSGRSRHHLATHEEIVEAAGGHLLIEYGQVGQRLVAVVLDDGQLRLLDVADVTAAQRAVAGLRLALRLALSAKPESQRFHALVETGRGLERLLLEPLELGGLRNVVLVADGPLVSTPWSLLPALADANLVVAASWNSWLSKRRQAPPLTAGARVLVVVGPGLRYAEDEAKAIRDVWNGPVTILTGEEATVARVVDLMARADIVHIAAHGTFRGDNPLLSAIRVHDGPLTGYELAQASGRAALAVLSCCETGMSDATSGVSLSRLLSSAGVAATIASVSPVSDAPAVDLMAGLYRGLARGARPAEALNEARRSVGGPIGSPSAAGFVCFGDG